MLMTSTFDVCTQLQDVIVIIFSHHTDNCGSAEQSTPPLLVIVVVVLKVQKVLNNDIICSQNIAEKNIVIYCS